LKKLAQQQEELRNRIALEVKTALAELESAKSEVEVANLGIDLAQQEVTQARDRFQAGVANNIEVITAQDELSAGNDNRSRRCIATTRLAPTWPTPPPNGSFVCQVKGSRWNRKRSSTKPIMSWSK